MFCLDHMKPVAYHKYTSSVRSRIFEMESYGNDEIEETRQYLLAIFKEAGIKCWDDNKIAFELEFEGKRIFYGFYDGTFHIGFQLYHWN